MKYKRHMKYLSRAVSRPRRWTCWTCRWMVHGWMCVSKEHVTVATSGKIIEKPWEKNVRSVCIIKMRYRNQTACLMMVSPFIFLSHYVCVSSIVLLHLCSVIDSRTPGRGQLCSRGMFNTSSTWNGPGLVAVKWMACILVSLDLEF